MQDFHDRLRIRATSHHARCAICVRHRLIIKRLPQGPARLAQIQQYKRHLSRQYQDRQIYWGHRSLSRSEACGGAPINHIACIIDGMDQSKHCYPRSSAMGSKEFSNWSRPRLAATTLISHGHAVIVGLSPENVPTSGSRTMELVAYMMTKTLNYVHWPNVFLHLEADNCSKELKHQTALRMMATMIASHRLKGAELSFLQSGHSHEDIDAHFSVTSAWLDRYPELWCIDDYQKCLTTMLSNKQVRVNEPKREVVVYDQFRDWIHDCTTKKCQRFPNQSHTFSLFVFSIGKITSKANHTTLGPLATQEAPLWRVAGPCSPERHWWTRGTPCAALGQVEGHRTDHTEK